VRERTKVDDTKRREAVIYIEIETENRRYLSSRIALRIQLPLNMSPSEDRMT
jgi:hypothetical protein